MDLDDKWNSLNNLNSNIIICVRWRNKKIKKYLGHKKQIQDFFSEDCCSGKGMLSKLCRKRISL